MPAACLHAAHPDDALDVSVHQLDNGLQIWLSVNTEEPRVFASVVARVGSGEDPPDATGLAHYMEHMLANKGTSRLGTLDAGAEAPLLAEISALFDQLFDTTDPDARDRLLERIDACEHAAARYAVPNELKQVYAAMGGRGFNATTNKERTNYFVDLPANMLERWMMLEADRFSTPVFRAFFSEVQTVVEEKNRALDDAGRRSAASLDRQLWGDHPYGTETLGKGAHLARPRVSRMRRFFDDWVVPSNMALVLAGDLDRDAVLALAEHHFGSMVDRPTPPRASPSAFPVIQGQNSEAITHHGPPAVHVAWRTVPFDHPDRPALRMADMLLHNGKTGLFDTALNATKVVRASGAFPRFYRDGGAQVVWVRPLADQPIDAARDLLLEQVERLRTGNFDSALLEAIFLHWEQGELGARESNKARGNWMTAAFVHRQSWADAQRELDRHRAVTPADIQRVAREWFGPDRVGVVRRTGDPLHTPVPAPTVTARPIETTAHSAFFHEVLSTPVAPLVPQELVPGRDWQVVRRTEGTIYANANPHSSLCQISWTWDHGYEGACGLSHALRLLTLAGEGGDSRVAFDRWLYDAGVRVAARCGRHDTALSLAGPSDAVAQVWDRVWRRWQAPEVDPDVGHAYLDDAIRRRQVDKTTKKRLVGAARGYALFGTDSTALAHSPSDAQLRSLLDTGADGRPAFVALLQPHLSSPRDLLYTGDATAAELVDALSPLVQPGPARPERPPVEKARTGVPRVILVHHASAQSSVTVYRSAGPHTVDRLGPGRVLGEVLGGSAGLFFQELREARGLAYATSGGLSFGARPGDDDLLWAHAATHPDKAAGAAHLLVTLLDRPLDDAGRFARARHAAVEGLRTERITARSVPGAARWWDRRGFVHDPRPSRLETVRGLDQAAVEAFRQSLSPGPPVVVVVGDLSRMAEADFSGLGDVETRTPESLFAY